MIVQKLGQLILQSCGASVRSRFALGTFNTTTIHVIVARD